MIEKKAKQYQGGYVAVLHKLEEKFYSKEMNLSGNEMKVMIFIKHRYLRNAYELDMENFPLKAIGKAEIVKATGIDKNQVKKILKKLIHKEYLLFTQIKEGATWGKNSYVLHPKFFGEDIVYNGVKKPLRYIPGGKKEPQKSYPQEEKNEAETQPKKEDSGVPHGTTVGGTSTPPWDAGAPPFEHENSAKPFYKTLSLNPFAARKKNEDTFGLSEQEIVNRNREKYFRQKETLANG